MVDDVVVGEVTEVERVGWHARGRCCGSRTTSCCRTTRSPRSGRSSLLGEKYVALEAADRARSPTGRLADGDTIALADTGRNPEVEEVLGALSFLLSGGGVAQLGTITREANLVMSGREDRLRVDARLARGRRRHPGRSRRPTSSTRWSR